MRTSILARSSQAAALALAITAGCNSSGPHDGRTSSRAVQAPGVTHLSDRNASNVMNFPTGERGSSVIQVEQVSPREVHAGAAYTYEIRVKNLTETSLQNVVLRATRPEGLKLSAPVDGTTAPRPDDKGWLTYAVGTLGPRETRTFTVTGMPTGDAVRQTYEVKLDQQMSTAVNVTSPAVTLAKTGPADADICQDIVWTYDVKNTGTGTVRGVMLRDQLPEGLTTRDGKTLVTADLGDIPAGATRQATAQLKAARAGKFASVATVQSEAGEAKSESVSLVVRQPKLDIAAKGPAEEYLGKAATYQVTVTNSGDTAAQGVVLRFGAPGGVMPVSVNDGEGAVLAAAGAAPSDRQPLGTIEAGKSKTVNVAFQPRQGGVFKLDATASGKCATDVAKSVETNILTVGALLLEANDLQDPVKVGDNMVYRIKVTNQGTGPDTNVNVVVTIPEGEEFVKAVGTTAGSGTGQTIHFATVPSLAAKASATWDVTIKAVKAGDVQFKVQATSDTVKAAAEKTEPTKLY